MTEGNRNIVPPNTEPLNPKVDNTEPTKVEPKGEPTATTPTGEVLPERFVGKSAEEIAKAYVELESQSGRQATELGEIKNEMGMLKASQGMAQYQNPAPNPEPPVWNPTTSSGRPMYDTPRANDPDDEELIDRRTVREMLQKQSKEDQSRMRYDIAFRGAETAKHIAKTQYPDLFNGIDDAQLNQLMYGGVKSGVMVPEVLSDPNGWAMTAWQVKGRQSGFTTTVAPPTPTEPIGTEMPNNSGSSGPTPTAPVATEGWAGNSGAWEKMGVTEEQQKAIMEKIQADKEAK